jgi:hypothetical protein
MPPIADVAQAWGSFVSHNQLLKKYLPSNNLTLTLDSQAQTCRTHTTGIAFQNEEKMKYITTIALASLAIAAQATVFATGDLAIVGYNSSNPDDVAIVALVAFESGTSFYMTDYGWRSANDGFRGGGEGWIKVTATRNYSAGEVFVIRREINGTSPAVAGLENADFTFEFDGATNPEFAPNGTGDQVFLFQGDFTDSSNTTTPATFTNGAMIFGLNAEGTGAGANGWQTDATSSTTSALPNALVEGQTAVGLFPAGSTELANAAYNRVVTSGTKEELLAAIANRANWTSSASLIDFDSSSYSVEAIPEPATMTALGLALVAIARKRRK